MLILGITNNDTAGACLVEGGNILSAVHEERFSRVKADKIWPEKSINYVLSSNGKTLDDIDFIAYGWKAGFNEEHCLNLYVERVIYECFNNSEHVDILKKRVSDELINDKEKRLEFDHFILNQKLTNKVCYIDHHDTHAWGAWLCSPYDDALVVTCDGRGDFISLTIRYIDCGYEMVLQRETTIDSLGYFYGRITHLLGFTPNRHEGKVTGLAAFGNPDNAMGLMKKMINVCHRNLRSNCGDYYQPSYHCYSDKLVNEVKLFSPQDIAAAAQKHLENIMVEMISPYIKKCKSGNLCLAGGLFGNVRLNQVLKEIPGINNVFVLPCMGDEGLPLAAAVTAEWRETGMRCSLKTMALGPDFSDQEVREMISQQRGIKMVEPDNVHDSVIELLRSDNVIALLRGRMEFGPRALCKRSIIYHAHSKEVNTWLNKKLSRTEFMPFAPVVPENLGDLCFYNWSSRDVSAEFMTITYRCKPIMASRCPAVVHVDNTARPQIVRESSDPFMYALLNTWYEMTGQPCLVNTSFNRHEEPIVNTPLEAISLLREGAVKAVVINDRFIVTKDS